MRAETRRARADLELPAAQQPVQRLQPDARAAARLEGRLADVPEGPGREPRRDRAAHLPHAAAPGRRLGGRLLRRPTPARSSSLAADEAVEIGGRGAGRELPRRRSDPRGGRAHRRRGDSSRATAFWPRTPTSRRAASARASSSSGRRPSRCGAFGAQAHRARAGDRGPACRSCRGRASSPTSRRRRQRPAEIGYPVMLKSTAGGGGIGMRRCAERRRARARRSTRSCALGARALQGQAASTSRSWSIRARHVEVQIFGDGAGRVLALGERDCSLQRRNQKVIEETPPPGLSAGDARRPATTRPSAWARRALSLGRHGRVRARCRATSASTSSRSTPASRSSTASPRR